MKKASIFVCHSKTLDFSNERNEWWHWIKNCLRFFSFETTRTSTYVFNFYKDVIILWACFTPTVCTEAQSSLCTLFFQRSRWVQTFTKPAMLNTVYSASEFQYQAISQSLWGHWLSRCTCANDNSMWITLSFLKFLISKYSDILCMSFLKLCSTVANKSYF